jgi:hypothetical protein
MPSPELENLVKISQLKREPPAAGEIEGLQRSGEARLSDAANPDLSLESRFDLAYNAAHALALAALRRLGYRSANRYLGFQTLSHTLGLPPSTWRVLAKGHESRNLAEYEGLLSVDERLVDDIVAAATTVLSALRAAGPGPGEARTPNT